MQEGTLSNLEFGHLWRRPSGGAGKLGTHSSNSPSLMLLPTPRPKTKYVSRKSVGETQECAGLSEHPRNDNIQPQEKSRDDPTPTHVCLWALPAWTSAPEGRGHPPSLLGRIECEGEARVQWEVMGKAPVTSLWSMGTRGRKLGSLSLRAGGDAGALGPVTSLGTQERALYRGVGSCRSVHPRGYGKG